MSSVEENILATRSLFEAFGAKDIIDSDFVHVITLRNGRWVRFRDFMNTAIAVAAFG